MKLYTKDIAETMKDAIKRQRYKTLLEDKELRRHEREERDAISTRRIPTQEVTHEDELESFMVRERLSRAALDNGSGKVITEKP